jgi:uncharacterized membrane protein
LTRGQVAWALCYAYLAYVFLGEAPGLGDLSIFSVQAVSALLVVVFLFSSYVSWGVATATKYLVGTWLASYAIEFVGLTTGYPFGHYAYTVAMGPFVGPVPVYIPFSWCALGYFCLQATGVSILAPAGAMALLDISFDPIFSRTLWHWQSTIGPQYFGVPVLNFVGWFLTAVAVFALFWIAVGERGPIVKKSIVLSSGSEEAIGFYLLFGISNVVSLINGGLPEAAAASMVLFVVLALVLWRSRARGGKPAP